MGLRQRGVGSGEGEDGLGFFSERQSGIPTVGGGCAESGGALAVSLAFPNSYVKRY